MLQRKKKFHGQFQNNMDTEKLISLAYESKEEVQKYRDQLLETLKNRRGEQSKLSQILERLKTIPDAVEALKSVSEQIQVLTKEIEDCYDTISILNNWKY